MASYRSRSRDSHNMRKRDEDQRENRGFRTRTPIRDRGRRVIERSPERRISRESRDRQERRQVEERMEARREEEFRENRFKTWSNGNGQYSRRARTYNDKDYKGKKTTESKREDKNQEKLETEQKDIEKSKMKEPERSKKEKPEHEESESSSSTSSESEEEDIDMMKELFKLAKQKEKEKRQNRRAIRKARKAMKSPSGNIARNNSPDSVSGYNSGKLYEQETTIIQPVKEDKKVSKVFRRALISGENEKQVTEKQVAVITPQVIPTPDPLAP